MKTLESERQVAPVLLGHMRKVCEQRVLHGLVAHVALSPALRGTRARGSDSNGGGRREYLVAPVAHELLEGAP